MIQAKTLGKILVSAITPFLMVAVFLLLFFVCQHDCFLPAQASDSPDAVGLRVMPNLNHYSPLSWYLKNITNQGSPQALLVDGYEAVRDGRSVYVNAANLSYANDSDTVGQDFYTNIYIISYNQDASQETKDIFGQLLKNWKFNNRLLQATGEGRCLPDNGPECRTSDDCRGNYLGYTCDPNNPGKNRFCIKMCWLDSDCPTDNYCNSAKAKIVRDVKRLSDIVEVNLALANYKSAQGEYPALTAGSYLPNKTISVWPSWQDTLSKTLGYQLPLDPVNKLGACPDFDPVTCWDEKKKIFATNFDDNGILPDRSLAYVYMYDQTGNRYKFCANFETTYPVIPEQHRCDSADSAWFGGSGTAKPQILIGNCVRPEGPFENCFVAAYGQYDIDWSKTEFKPLDPNDWSLWANLGWAWKRIEGLELGNTSLPSHKELLARSMILPDSRNYGIFKYQLTIYDVKGNFNQQEGVIKICSPRTCAEAGAECGRVPDNCGGTLLCGQCANDLECVNNKCV